MITYFNNPYVFNGFMAGIYVHIPFCKKKCIYCDFFSVGASPENVEAYADLIIKEYEARREELGGEAVRTVYFGGGTPSLMSPRSLARILGSFRDMESVGEVTLEVNPDDVTPDFVRDIREAGINRVSMGVQSFDDAELRFLMRRHDARGAEMAVDCLRNGGIENVSIDLIYGIPGQTVASWERSLRKAIGMGLPHLSSYCLTYEEGTLLTRKRDKGEFEPLTDEGCVAMYDCLASEMRKAGYEHYEISNFALPGFRSRHNSAYWNFTPYLGLGASAHSFDGRCRRYNPSSLRGYRERIEQDGVACEIEQESVNELYNEWVMTRLRTSDGMSLNDLQSRFGEEKRSYAEKAAAPYLRAGDLKKEADVLSLTDRGVMVSDAVFRDLFIV